MLHFLALEMSTLGKPLLDELYGSARAEIMFDSKLVVTFNENGISYGEREKHKP